MFEEEFDLEPPSVEKSLHILANIYCSSPDRDKAEIYWENYKAFDDNNNDVTDSLSKKDKKHVEEYLESLVYQKSDYYIQSMMDTSDYYYEMNKDGEYE